MQKENDDESLAEKIAIKEKKNWNLAENKRVRSFI